MKTIGISLILSVIFLSSCEKYLDQKPQDQVTDIIYYQNASQFRAAANFFYDGGPDNDDPQGLYGFDGNDSWDAGTDLSGMLSDYGEDASLTWMRGSMTPPDQSDWWDEPYKNLRSINELIMKAEEYPGNIWDATFSWRSKNPPVLGYEFWDIAVGRLVKQGDPAILDIQSGRTEVKQGDFILPIDDHVYDAQFFPHAMAPVPDGLEVVALTQASYGAGHYQIIAINAGRNQGVETGHVFSAFRPGQKIQDEVKYPTGSWEDQKTLNGDKVTLPDQFSAHILIFRVFDEVSYAIIMSGERPVRTHDILKHPDETL